MDTINKTASKTLKDIDDMTKLSLSQRRLDEAHKYVLHNSEMFCNTDVNQLQAHFNLLTELIN